MSCKFDKEIIQRYVDNRIEPLELVFLKEHLNYCDNCQEQLELINTIDKKLFEQYDNMTVPFNIDVLCEKVLDKCIEEESHTKGIRKFVRKSYETSKDMLINTTRFTKYIPGNKILKKGISASTQFVRSSTKKYARNKFKKLLGNII